MVLGLVTIAVLAGSFLQVNPPAPPAITQQPTRVEDKPSVDPPSEDTALSRAIAESIYRNLRHDVHYVGDAQCTECHEEICGTYHQHPMGRSAIVAGSDPLEQYGPDSKNPFRVGPYELTAVNSENGMMHRMSAVLADGSAMPPLEVPVQIAIGSGTRGRSYLTIDGEYVWQSPISWYSTNQRWDVSPGFDLGYATQRPIVSECLYCHVQQYDAIANTVNRYREPIHSMQLSIGCERCHGPGQLHVDERRSDASLNNTQHGDTQHGDAQHGDIDTSIVNPAHLSDSLQMSICAQCHLSGRERVVRRGRSENEFRPGLPFEQFATAFLAHPDAPFRNKAVSHFDQSVLAKCRTAAGSQLLCTSCHDPHRSPEPELAASFYNQQCIDCHVDRGCSAPVETRQAKGDSCIDCHMPKSSSSNIPHTSLTDHRIRRDPNAPDAKGSFDVSDIPLILYAREGLADPEIDRDLGIALSRFAAKQSVNSAFRKEALEKARVKLTDALRRWPDDVDAWLALSETEKWSGNMPAALTAAQNGLQQVPDNEDLLSQVANLADAANQPELAWNMLNRLLVMVPSSHDYLAKRMLTGVTLGNWEQAEKDCRELLRLNPLFPSARLVRAMTLFGDGQKAEARREIDAALALATTPAQKGTIQSWFDRFVAWRSKFDE
jgi:predicted CXXCH cytochrome family protein